jgi:hypothetical protein
MKKRYPLILVFFLILRAPVRGLDSEGLLTIPIGGQAAGTATSFTAAAGDPSFLESNPAGSARFRRTELAFFHNSWTADALAEELVFVHGMENLGLAAAGRWLYTSLTEYDPLTGRNSASPYSEIEAILNGAYNFFPGARFSGIAVGASLKGLFPIVSDRGAGEKDRPAAAVMGDLGFLSSFDMFKFYGSPEQNASVGLALRNAGWSFGSGGLPTTAALGLTYRPLRPLLLSFDFFLPLDLRDPGIPESPYFAAGLAFDGLSFLALRGGIRVKDSEVRLALGTSFMLPGNAAPPPGETADSRGMALDLNYSLDMGPRIQPVNRLGLGIRAGLGDRSRAAVKASRVETLYTDGLEAYGRRDYPEALRCWKEALELDPQFLPAEEALALLDGPQGR